MERRKGPSLSVRSYRSSTTLSLDVPAKLNSTNPSNTKGSKIGISGIPVLVGLAALIMLLLSMVYLEARYIGAHRARAALLHRIRDADPYDQRLARSSARGLRRAHQ
jgi:hypothetical protein